MRLDERLAQALFLAGLHVMRNSDQGSTVWWVGIALIRRSFRLSPALREAVRIMGDFS